MPRMKQRLMRTLNQLQLLQKIILLRLQKMGQSTEIQVLWEGGSKSLGQIEQLHVEVPEEGGIQSRS